MMRQQDTGWLLLAQLTALSLLVSCETRKLPKFILPQGESSDGRPIKTAYQCEGEEVVLSCEPGTSIQIVRSNYGRFSIAVCNQQGYTSWSVNCASPTSLDIMKKMCDRLSVCVVPVNSETFLDSCPGTSKYLEVHFVCVNKSLLRGAADRQNTPQFPDAQLSELWNPNSKTLSLEKVLEAAISSETQPIPVTEAPLTSSSTDRDDPPTTVQPEEPDGDQETEEPLDYGAVTPVEETGQQESGDAVLSQRAHDTAHDTLVNNGDWPANNTQDSGRQQHQRPYVAVREDPAYVLQVVTYSVAAVCGLIILLIVIRVRKSLKRRCMCLKTVQDQPGETSSSVTESTSGSHSPYQRSQVTTEQVKAAYTGSVTPPPAYSHGGRQAYGLPVQPHYYQQPAETGHYHQMTGGLRPPSAQPEMVPAYQPANRPVSVLSQPYGLPPTAHHGPYTAAAESLVYHKSSAMLAAAPPSSQQDRLTDSVRSYYLDRRSTANGGSLAGYPASGSPDVYMYQEECADL